MLDLLGDFGGFNDAIYFLLSLPLGFYASSMFSRHISSFFKQSKRSKGKKQQGINDALRGVLNGESRKATLQGNERGAIVAQVIKGAKRAVYVSCWKALCYTRWFCRRDPERRAMQAAVNRFIKSLDVAQLY